jgi:hypothetical protein
MLLEAVNAFHFLVTNGHHSTLLFGLEVLCRQIWLNV